MMKKTPLPTPLAVTRAMNTLIEGEYWPATLSTEGAYVRRHDDTNGETGIEQELAVTFSPDGDAWIMLPGMTSLRFRTWAGGGMSLRVRKGLMVLAEAIRRDNAERPQHDQSETVDPRVQTEEAQLYRELTGVAVELGYGGLVDALADLAKLRLNQPEPDTIAAEVLRHIDTMYPAMWETAPKTARTSVRNTIISQVKRFTSTGEKA